MNQTTGASDLAQTLPAGLVVGRDGQWRCAWCSATPDYEHYHDHEWGFAVTDDRRLFEKICLEGFQAGLSWLTVLRKRENFRAAFAQFDYQQLASFSGADVERLLADSGIIRHRGKIESVINNAQRALELAEQFGSLAAYFWSFEPDPATRPLTVTWQQLKQITSSDESVALSRDLKRRGWRFVGPTTMYAFMQAMGLVNDHLTGCASQPRAAAVRAQLDRAQT